MREHAQGLGGVQPSAVHHDARAEALPHLLRRRVEPSVEREGFLRLLLLLLLAVPSATAATLPRRAGEGGVRDHLRLLVLCYGRRPIARAVLSAGRGRVEQHDAVRLREGLPQCFRRCLARFARLCERCAGALQRPIDSRGGVRDPRRRLLVAACVRCART